MLGAHSELPSPRCSEHLASPRINTQLGQVNKLVFWDGRGGVNYMLNVNKSHVKECELPVAHPPPPLLSIPIQVLHFTSG